ncbi:FtsQ-type POTRA domain-containing protein [Bdellovibrionota bacterium FG-1]
MGQTSLRKAAILVVTFTAIFGAAWGVRHAMRSPLFVLQVVEVADQPEGAPVDAQTLSNLADLPVGKVNLFDLELGPIEERILSNAWIREVRLQKHFPQTLSISVVFREPQAILQSEGGVLSYVDVDGKAFGQVSLMYQPDLPMITASGAGHVVQSLRLLKSWAASELGHVAQISSLQWEPERGFRVWVTYALAASTGRTLVDLGQDIDGEVQFRRLAQVFHYLTANHVQVRQIWADAEKKIVVRTARGS